MRNWITACTAAALLLVATIGCQKTETVDKGKNGKGDNAAKKDGGDSAKVTKAGLNLPAKICGQCGGEGKEGCCEKAKEGTMCKCGFAKGSYLCCTGVEKIDGAYCGKCGAVAGSDTCCKGEACEKCGLNGGSALCCKLKSGEEGHDHKDGDHDHKDGDHDHKDGDDKDGDDKDKKDADSKVPADPFK